MKSFENLYFRQRKCFILLYATRIGHLVDIFRVDTCAKWIAKQTRVDVSLLLKLHGRAEKVLIGMMLIFVKIRTGAAASTVQVERAPILRRL